MSAHPRSRLARASPPDTPVQSGTIPLGSLTMPFLTSDGERYPLRLGINTLGGRGADVVAPELTPLAALPPAAEITLHPDETVFIKRLSAIVVVKVDGDTIGATSRGLHDGSVIEIGKNRLIYDAAALEVPVHSGASAPQLGQRRGPSALRSRARLVAVRGGKTFPIAPGGLLIGRDDACHLVVVGKGVSRHHAAVHPDRQGYVLLDQSANGTHVNGVRAAKAQPLAPGDVIRVGTEDFRFESDPVVPGPTEVLPDATGLITVPQETASLNVSAAEANRSSPNSPDHSARPRGPAPAPLASLEVTGGPLGGMRFQIERPVCAIGRAEGSDVRLADETVSASHATLLFKRGTWFVVDLHSANGTFVDDSRIAGERTLPDGCTLRVGSVKMTFHQLATVPRTGGGTRRLGRMFGRLTKLF
ncbi:MAG: hypothetical protein NVS4B3_10230 [Gemmatimonadaceae bacterium]